MAVVMGMRMVVMMLMMVVVRMVIDLMEVVEVLIGDEDGGGVRVVFKRCH